MSQGSSSIEMQSAMNEMVKRMGSKLLFGEFANIMNVKKPAGMCKELTLLEAVANEHQFCSLYLNKAAQADPIDQIKLVTAYLIAGLHSNCATLQCKAPLEPILGETIQLLKQDGTTYYGEQIIAQPSTQCYFLTSSNYKVTGTYQLILNMSKTFNTLYGEQQGKCQISFLDGTNYICTFPQVIVQGLIAGERIMNFTGKMTIQSPQTNIIVELEFAKEKSLGQKFLNFFSTNNDQNQPLPDSFTIEMNKMTQIDNGKQEKTLLCKGEGSWVEYLKFGDEIFWRIDQEVDPWERLIELLPSDSSLRIDRQLIKDASILEATRIKQLLDLQEEKDAQLRKLNQ